jgi:hypothetical protein
MGRMKDFDIRIRNGGDDAIAAVSEYVAELELEYERLRALVPRWIPVTERLPDFGREVLIYWIPLGDDGLPACAGCDRRGGLIETAFRQRIDGEECWLAESGTDTVPTHWMPLPEPPAGTVAMLREQWQQLHKGPGPSPMVGIDQGEGESWTPQP